MTIDINAARTAWERLEAGCAGLLARQCKYHLLGMGCPTDCSDIANALEPEFAEAKPLIEECIAENAQLRLELAEAHEALTAARLELAQSRTLLAEAQPCGWDEPQLYPLSDGTSAIDLPSQWAESTIDADDARHMARMLLRAADTAESTSAARAGEGGG